MSETFTPLLFTCVVDLDPIEQKTAGGIIKPQERVERDQASMTRATVRAVGSEAFSEVAEGGRIPKPGDRVLVKKYAGTFLGSPDDTLRVVNDREILCIIEETD